MNGPPIVDCQAPSCNGRRAGPGAMGMVMLVVLLAACGRGPAADTPDPTAAVPTETSTSPPPTPRVDPDGPALSEPPPALLQIRDASQVAGVGSYCWSNRRDQPAVCLDKLGIPTPQDPLQVESPLPTVIRLPLELQPETLQLTVIPVGAEDELPPTSGGQRWWPPLPGEAISLPAEIQPQVELNLDEGLYLVSLFAAWEGVGDVTYGYLIEVTGVRPQAIPALETDVTAVTTLAEAVTLYSGPGSSYPLLSTSFGRLVWDVTGISEDGDWWRLACQDENGELMPECWVSADPAVSLPADQVTEWVPARTSPIPYVQIVASPRLRLRNAPSLEAEVIAMLSRGELHPVTGISENRAWWRLRCPNGRVGDCWISADLQLSVATPITRFSLDGLVYRPDDKEELWLVTAGGQPIQWLDSGVDLTLAPDGEAALRCCSPRGENDLRYVDLTTNQTRRLTDTPDRFDFNPHWWPASPDEFVFLSRAFDPASEAGQPGPANLGLGALDGSGHAILDPEGLIYTRPAPAPDGETIAYDRGGNTAAIHGILSPWLYSPDGGPRAFDFGAHGLDPLPGLTFGSPTWSPDGGTLAWVVAGDLTGAGLREVGLALFDLEARTVDILNPFEPAGSPFVWSPPAPLWSPGGRWIAWQGSPAGEDPGFWIIPVSGEAPRFFDQADSPTWSPDGRLVAFNKRGNLFVMEPGVWEQQLTGLPEDSLIHAWLDLD